MGEMQNNLFRKNAMETLSSPERLHEYIKITRPGIWAALIGFLVLLISVGSWGYFGSIPNTINAKGVVFPQDGVISVIPISGGRITDMRVGIGDYVTAGQIIAVIPQNNILDQIEEYKKLNIDNREQLSEYYSKYERNSLVLAPVSGIVLYAAGTNETISSTEVVARIVKQEKYSDSHQIITYITNSTAKKLKEGMEVQVSPEFAPREEYGYMYGHITSVGTYPVSDSDIVASLGDLQYAQGLSIQNNSVEVRITLTVDSNSKNKIKWSNRKGEDISLSIGTYTNMLIVINDYKLYELLFQ